MFKRTAPLYKALRRLRLTTKQAANEGGYYKGNRTGSMGWHTKHARYIIDLRKVRTFVPPIETEESALLTPFVPRTMKYPDTTTESYISSVENAAKEYNAHGSYFGVLDGPKYLTLWKAVEQIRTDSMEKVNNDAQYQDTSAYGNAPGVKGRRRALKAETQNGEFVGDEGSLGSIEVENNDNYRRLYQAPITRKEDVKHNDMRKGRS